jgi:hypothetical protein
MVRASSSLQSFLVAALLAASPAALAQPRVGAHATVDTQGWTLLGQQEVKGKRDRDTIMVGKYEGRFDQIQLVVLDSDIELKELTVHFANGEKWSPALKASFKEGQRSKAIDLPGNNRQIAKIELVYANTPGGGAAKVAIYGRDKAAKMPTPMPASFDPKGWTLLGQQEVKGKRDRDTIHVGRYEGTFDQLQLVVLDSDIELKDLVVYFADGQKWSPSLRTSFKEGQRSKAIDLPGNNRTIVKIELLYQNTPGGGAAKVAIYGRDKKANNNPGPMPPQPQPVAFDSRGWTMLGEQSVDGLRDKDTIKVGKYAGAFDQLTMVVSDSDLDLQSLTVVFPKGQKWSPSLRKTFKEGSRTHVIDLPGKDRIINKIELKYANIAGGGKAKVQIYGRDAGRQAPPPIVAPSWDNKGWTLLGKSTVDGWRDRDHLNVSQGKPFSEVMFVVAGSDVELKNITINLGNGEKFAMPTSVIFREGTRTAPIDIPGKLRKIKSVDFAYANLPGGGRAQVEIWARAKAQPAGMPMPGPSQGPSQGAPGGVNVGPGTPPPPPVVRDHRN